MDNEQKDIKQQVADEKRIKVLLALTETINALVDGYGKRQGGLVGFDDAQFMHLAQILDATGGLFIKATDEPVEERRIVEAKIVPVLK
jgi:hypothetical protein